MYKIIFFNLLHIILIYNINNMNRKLYIQVILIRQYFDMIHPVCFIVLYFTCSKVYSLRILCVSIDIDIISDGN